MKCGIQDKVVLKDDYKAWAGSITVYVTIYCNGKMERLVIRGAYGWTVRDFGLVILNWISLIDIKAVLFSKQLGCSDDIRTRDINLGVISIAENI